MSTGGSTLDRVVHDLRGPLMPLQTAAYLLKHERDQLDPQRQQELIDIIQRQSQRMARMLEEFGDWSRAEQQRLLRTFSPCEPGPMLDQAIGSVPGCAIEPTLDPGCAAARIHGDEFRLTQAMRTLLEYIHARDGAATLHGTCAAGQLQLRFRDRGAPLDTAQAGSLLSQPDPAPRDEGLGLRLMLARSIIEAHGGSVEATSMPDGLVIDCRLPLAASDPV